MYLDKNFYFKYQQDVAHEKKREKVKISNSLKITTKMEQRNNTRKAACNWSAYSPLAKDLSFYPKNKRRVNKQCLKPSADTFIGVT